MLLNIGIILIILWFIGLIAFPVLGWFIHLLLIIAIIIILLRIIRRK
ncbi:MAG: lmo0937 family membrane protein [Patescibacteria group bacterium]